MEHQIVHKVQDIDIYYDALKNQFYAEVNGKVIRSNNRSVVEKKIMLLVNKGTPVIYDTSYHNGEYPKKVQFLYWTKDKKAVVRYKDGDVHTLSKYDAIKCFDDELYNQMIELNKQIDKRVSQRQEIWMKLVAFRGD